MTVLIAGGGIAGLSLGLTCHQLGIPFRVFESSAEIKPLGLGINLQPNAVRELFDLGFEDSLDSIGVRTQEFGLFTKHGLEIWMEPRGVTAGYRWPQFSVHRGYLQTMLYRALIERAGADSVQTGWRAVRYRHDDSGKPVLELASRAGQSQRVTGDLLIGADGIHSKIRAQMHPAEGPPIWNGRVLWRGTSLAKPWRTGATMVMLGHDTQRFVAYPITPTDTATGLAVINWIAELAFDSSGGWKREDWNRQADISEFLPRFTDWKFGWLNVPELVTSAEAVFEYPMVDRDPLDTWRDGLVSLIGDAAHATYPVGSNGASQAIVDARKLGKAFVDHGVTQAALEQYESEMRPATQNIILANRGKGPDAVMQLIEDRCGGKFEKLEDVATYEELATHAAKYKKIAGFSIDELNALPPTISPGSRLV
jgi:2-polyprenyl-6-methoxyphenol hydroxylase-like FAD-dependent oxidoreductase